MSTFTVTDIIDSPDRVSAAVERDGSARLRTPDGREYVLRAPSAHAARLPRVKGVTLHPPVSREEISSFLRPDADEEAEWAARDAARASG
jgi:hypothetical protein